MSENFNPLYDFLPFPPDNISPEQLNDALRQIDDSLKYLREEILSGITRLPLWVPNQYYLQAGVNEDVDTGSVPEDLWTPGGILTYPNTAAQVSIVSTDVNDTAAGTGLQEIYIRGVTDDPWDEIEETIELNGTTPVLSTQNYLFVNKMIGTRSGGNGVTNVGDVNASIGGNLVRQIAAGKGQCTCSHIVIPKARIAGEYPFANFLVMEAGRTSGFVTMDLIAQSPPYTNTPERVVQAYAASADGGAIPGVTLDTPIYVAPGTRITQRIIDCSGNNMQVRSSLGIGYQPMNPEAIPFVLNVDIGSTVSGLISGQGF